MKTDNTVEIHGTVAGREIGAGIENRLQKAAALCLRAAETGKLCDVCGSRRATTMHTDQIEHSIDFRCDHCRPSARRPSNTADTAAMENYLRSKGIS